MLNNSTTAGSLTGIHLCSNSAYAGVLGRRSGSNMQALDFYTENTTRTVKMSIAPNGNVGIGTTGPKELLDVRGNITASGNLTINGTLTKGGGTFKIANPTPGKDTFLYHSFVEAPTAGDNLYRYEIEAKEDNEEIIIDLPDYWIYLNENPQVWVSPVDIFAHSYGWVTENRLHIKCEKIGIYNVLLIGTRKDPFIKKYWKGVERKT